MFATYVLLKRGDLFRLTSGHATIDEANEALAAALPRLMTDDYVTATIVGFHFDLGGEAGRHTLSPTR
jgi:hypothetical protein